MPQLQPPETRRPLSVYADGDEPDPRFSLANERTFLAYLRTALALVAASAAVSAFDLPLPEVVVRLAGALLSLAALVTAFLAWRGWVRTERALRRGQPLPSPAAAVPVALGIVLVAATLAVVSVWS